MAAFNWWTMEKLIWKISQNFQESTCNGTISCRPRQKDSIKVVLLWVFQIFWIASLQNRSSIQRRSVKKIFLKISRNSQENACARVSFLVKLQAETCNFIKREALALVFYCEFCEIFKNTFFCRITPDDCFWQNTSRRLLIKFILWKRPYFAM